MFLHRRNVRSFVSPLLLAITVLAPAFVVSCGPLDELIDELHDRGGGAGGGGVKPPPPPPPAKTTCGGITGKACPGGGKCVDDPSDTCDPAKGGADCGGICTCVETVLCVKGAKFDASPAVCACVPETPVCGPVCAIYCPFGNVLDSQGCPTCSCIKPTPGATCQPDQCTGPGPKSASYQCPDGKTVAGPACVVDANGACNWTIVRCPS